LTAIDDKYAALGGPSGWLGAPAGPESIPPDGVGRFRHFQGGSIYWAPATGAHEVHGAIRGLWSQLGWERSFLGYPATDESPTPDGVGRFNHFQGGSIYWTPQTGAHEVHGAIRGLWSQLGWERSFLGYPLTNETATPDGVGRFNHFQGGSIYWTPTTGAHEVHGAIRGLWSQLGWERSFLGYPLSNELSTADGASRYSLFQHGVIVWSATGGAVACRELLRVHVKVLTTPTVPIVTSLAEMQTVYSAAEIGVICASIETLNLPTLNDCDVGQCVRGQTTTEQNQLFANRNNVGAHDVVAYFVRSTNPPLNGCAAHPNGQPGAVIAQGATRWTLGHELGHVLGLNHVNDNNRLMTGNGTANITNPPPDLISSEIQTMRNSDLTV
jgi:uncharacterized protein with LGFP repeats